MKSIAIIQLSSYSAALDSLNSIDKYQSLKFLELISFGTYSQILLEGDSEEINSYRKFLKTADLQKSAVFKYDDRIIKAFYHLEHSPVESHVLTLESSFVGNIFSAVGEFFEAGYKIVDFSMPRFPEAKAVLIMTSNSVVSDKGLFRKNDENKLKITYIENIGYSLKDFLT